MNYFFIALITTSGASFIIYFLLNKFLHTKIQVIPLLLCAACSLFLSMVLPKFVVRYTDWIGTIAVLALFTMISAYFLAYYDEKSVEKQMQFKNSGECLHQSAQSPVAMPGEVAATMFPFELNLTAELPNENLSNSISVLETIVQSGIPDEVFYKGTKPIATKASNGLLEHSLTELPICSNTETIEDKTNNEMLEHSLDESDEALSNSLLALEAIVQSEIPSEVFCSNTETVEDKTNNEMLEHSLADLPELIPTNDKLEEDLSETLVQPEIPGKIFSSNSDIDFDTADDEKLNQSLTAILQPVELIPVNEDTNNNSSTILPVLVGTSFQAEIPPEISYMNPETIAAETADEMLSRAFRLKELRDYSAAAQLFRNVLLLNSESSAAPLLLLEVADALRHTGELQAAKKVLVDSLSYPTVTGTLGEHKIRAMIDSLEQC